MPTSSRKRLHQLVRSVRTQQARHVLDAENMRAHLLQFFRDPNVVLQRVFVAFRIENIARVADRQPRTGGPFRARLRRRPACSEASSENRRCGKCRCPARQLRGRTRVRRYPDKRYIRRHSRLAAASGSRYSEWPSRSTRKALPWIFVQEAHGDIERCAAPHLQAVQVGQSLATQNPQFASMS